MGLQSKIKAGALQYVLVVSVVIAIVIFAFISLLFLQQRLQIKNNFQKETIHNVNLGFDYAAKVSIPYNQKSDISFSENDLEETTIHKKKWGLFDVITVSSKVKKQEFKKTGITGDYSSNRDALYLQENNKALVLVGNTKITGNVKLPKQRVKRGNIAGISYYGNRLIYGNIKNSSTKLPAIKKIEDLKNIYTNFKNENPSNFEIEEEMIKHHSFDNQTLIYESFESINLREVSLSGNIVIASKTKIIVNSSAKLEDVILIAPSIEIKSNTKGNFQAFASEKIDVKSSCSLKYPSALVLLEKSSNKNSANENKIHVSKNNDIRGVIVFHSENKPNFNTQIQIEEKSKITGEVYCLGNLELGGSIFGSAYTNNFIVKKSGGIFINYILNGEINANDLSNQYCGLSFSKGIKKVAKWVN